MALPLAETMMTPGTPAGVSSMPRKSLPYFSSAVSPGKALTPSLGAVETTPAPVKCGCRSSR